MKEIKQMLKIKSEIHTLKMRFKKLKNKKSIQKNREEIFKMRRDFANILYDNYEKISLLIEKVTDENKNAFCVMSMVGGPYFVNGDTSLHVYKCGYGNIQVVFDCYVGVLNLLEDKCGIDNLKILANSI